MLLDAPSVSREFATFRQQVAGLGSSPSSRYFHPHRPLLFLALASLFEPAENPPAELPNHEFPLHGDLAGAYHRLAAPGEQWPPKPADAYFGLHRAGVYTVHGPDGTALDRGVGRKPAGRLGDFVAHLGGERVRMLVDPRTRPYLLAAAFFQFCPRQKEALAAAWDELGLLLAERDVYEQYAETDGPLPIAPPTLDWAPLEKPPRFEHPEDFEKFFRRVLDRSGQRISILGQVPLDQELVEHVGKLLRRHKHYDSRYPLTICIYLVWCGILYFEGGNYWDPVCSSIGLTNSATHDWGMLFEKTVERLKLPSFKDEKSYRFVTPILAHGGVPQSCLPDLFENLVLPAAEGQFGDLQGAEILREWRDDQDLLRFRFKAVTRFFLKGGRPADDFFERCVRMAAHYLDTEEVLPASALGLPPHVTEVFSEWIHGEEGETAVAGDRLRRPYMQLQPGSRVVLHLPVQRLVLGKEHVPPRLEWKVGNLPARRCTLHDRGEFLETEAEVLDWPAPRQGVKCTLLEDGRELRSWPLPPFVPPGQEWLFLDASSGRPLPPDPLPRGEVWLLGEAQVRGKGLRVEEELPPLLVDGKPWTFLSLDLRRLKSVLELQCKAQNLTFVCEPEAPWLEGGAALGTVETGAGFPVYQGAAPDLCIPPESAGSPLAGWTVMLRPLPGSYPTHLRVYQLDQLGDFVSVERDCVRLPLHHLLPRDAAGRFELTLTGPLGRDRSFTLALVPEVRLDWRVDEADPAVEVHCPDGVFRPAGSAEWVEAGDGHLLVTTTAEQRYLTGNLATARSGVEVDIPLRLWIPVPRWRVTGVADSDEGWTRALRPLALEAVEEAEAGSLWIECPPASTEALQVALEGGGQQLQVQRAGTSSRGEVCVPLAAFRDTLRHARLSSLHVTLNFPVGSEWRKLSVLGLRSSWAPRSFEATYLGSGNTRLLLLSWEGPARVRDRSLRFRALWQPGRAPLEVAVPDDEDSVRIPIGPSGLGPGRYALEFAILDPWCAGLVVAGDTRLLNVLPDEWEAHLMREDNSLSAILERLLAVLEYPEALGGVLGKPRVLAAALCRDRPAEELRDLLALLANLQPDQAERVWPFLIPHMPLDEAGLRLLLASSTRLAGRELLQLTLRAGLPQAQPDLIDAGGRNKLGELWRPYGQLFAPLEDELHAPPLGRLVADGPDLGWTAEYLLEWVAELAPQVREVMIALQGNRAARTVTDRLLKERRQEKQTTHWRTYQVQKYLEFQQYGGTWGLMAVREGRGVVRDQTRRLCESRLLVPLSEISRHSFFDAVYCARFVIAAVAIGQRSRARGIPELEPVADRLRYLGKRCFALDRNFYGECLVSAESELRRPPTGPRKGA